MTASKPRIGGRPDGWFIMISDGPILHFDRISCLAFRMRPTSFYNEGGVIPVLTQVTIERNPSGGPPGEPDPPSPRGVLPGGGPDD